MPNTPRERLALIRDHAHAAVVGGYVPSELGPALIRELCDVLLSTGLLDQAGQEGSGQGDSERANDGQRDATVPYQPPASADCAALNQPPASAPGEETDDYDYGAALRELIPDSAPASVEGFVNNTHVGDDDDVMVRCSCVDWPIGTRVRITRLDPEGQ